MIEKILVSAIQEEETNQIVDDIIRKSDIANCIVQSIITTESGKRYITLDVDKELASTL